MNRRAPWSLAVAVAAGALGLCACSAVLGLREIDPLPGGDGGNASDGGDGGGGPGVEGGGPARAWMSGFLLRSVVDDTYRTQSADDAQRWFTNIGTWRTGTSRNNCMIFDSIAYPDPGRAPSLKMDGRGGNDDAVYVQAMYDFFAAPANNVAYETVLEGIDGTDVGPLAKSVLYPMPKQAAGGKNGPFHDGADSLPLATAKYHALFGAR